MGTAGGEEVIKTSFPGENLTSSTAALFVSVWSLGLGSIPLATHFQDWIRTCFCFA